MGYAGYTPAKLPPALPTPVEAAVGAVRNGEALDLIHKVVYNAAVAPKEEKFRRLRLSNEKVNALVVQVPGASEAMQALGWVQEEADLDFMVMPAGVYASMKQVRVIEAARDRLKKDAEEAHKERLRQLPRATGPGGVGAPTVGGAAVKVLA